jgi:hypothetical protein
MFSKTETFILETDSFTAKVVVSADSKTSKKKMVMKGSMIPDGVATMETGDEVVTTKSVVTLTINGHSLTMGENEYRALYGLMGKVGFDNYPYPQPMY